MKRIFLFTALYLTTVVQVIPAETPNPAAEQALLQLIKDVQAQQVSIAENQAKIDERIAAVAEAVRVARIYSSRSGN